MLTRIFSFLFFVTAFSISSLAQTSTITIKIDSKEASSGEVICLNVSGSNFRRILSTQYSIQWDPAVLSYSGLINFKLPYMTKENFGIQSVSKGILTCMWIDNSLKGVNLVDDSSLYQICFKVVGKSGGVSSIKFTQKPTPFESVNLEEKLVTIQPVSGNVKVK
jgi:hypothetical protein